MYLAVHVAHADNVNNNGLSTAADGMETAISHDGMFVLVMAFFIRTIYE
jgi:hypothetical protein